MTVEPDLPQIQASQAALRDGRLLIGHCRSCETYHHYPRSYCPHCGSGDTQWVQADGSGQIYSLTIWRRKNALTVPAFVTLREGPSLLATIVCEQPGAVRIGDAVRLLPDQPDGGLPAFSPYA